PRDRPRAWSSGSSAGRFFFRGPRRRAGGADVGAVDAEQLGVDHPGFVEAQLQPLDKAVGQAALAQGVEAVVDGLPGAVALRQVPPGGAGVEAPEDPIEHQAIFLPLAARLARTGREEGSEQFPLLVRKFVSLHTKLEARARYLDSSDRA